ncbi:MAG: penicillin-binding protein activator [Oligoflexia bacterium]|nr:penicillin-binding protein activator [Oligoflexia bacterium]
MIKRKDPTVAALGVCAIVLSGLCGACATAPRSTERGASPPTSGKVQSIPIPEQPNGALATPASTRENAELKSITELYQKGEFETALQRLGAFEKTFPRSSLLPQIRNLAGLCYLLTRRPVEAAERFGKALQNHPRAHSFNQYILYNLARARFEANQLREAEEAAGRIDSQALDRENQIKLHHLKAGLLLKRNAGLEAAREVLVANRLMSPQQSQELRPTFSTTLELALESLPSTASLEDLYREFEDVPYADLVLFRLASRERSQNDTEKAAIHAQILLSRYPQSPYYAEASSFASVQEPEAPVEGRTIGVLLPLRGKFGRFGLRSLHSIELAFGIFDPASPDTKVNLVIEDTGDEPEQAVKALERLVREGHAVAVIGPLLTKGLDQVSRRAQELRVPLITLARQEGAPSDYVLPAGITLRLQATELARFAIERKGLKRFAILAPRDRVGEEFLQYFWTAAESLGGEVTGAESYTSGETDFRQQVDKLSGLYYTEARQRELDELAKAREENKIKKKTRKTEQFYNLKPIVDYDAVFIPDEPKVAGQVLPTFSYRDVDNMIFLGPSAWNSPELASRGGAYAERAFFVEAFRPEDPAPAARRFMESYKAAFGTDPTVMEAAAYDAAKLVSLALEESGTEPSRSEVLDRLRGLKDIPGATGSLSFRDGQFFRGMRTFTVRGGQISEVK